jgi:hypothetical protein
MLDRQHRFHIAIFHIISGKSPLIKLKLVEITLLEVLQYLTVDNT